MSALKFTFSRKLAVAFSSIIFLSVVVPGAMLHQLLKKQLINELTQSLTHQAALLAHQLEPKISWGNPGQLSQQVKDWEKICRCRVTIVRNDGLVMEESDLDQQHLLAMENHAERLEIKQALSGQMGSSIRTSQTVNEDMLYAAVPLVQEKVVAGVVRLALPLTNINKNLHNIRKSVLGIAVGMILAVWILSIFLARSISRPVQAMSAVAEKLGEGNYSARVTAPGHDELGALGATLNSLAEKIESQIRIISEEKSHLSAVLAHMADGVAVVDKEGRIVLVNPALANFFHIDLAAAPGKMFLEVLRESKLTEILDRVTRQQKHHADEIRTFSGDERIFEAHGVPMLDNERYIGSMLVLHDITKVRQLEQIRRDFIANVSHELRTPLSAIKGFAETLLSGGVDDQENRLGFIRSIEQQSNRMATLITDLLDLTAIESGHRRPQISSFEISRLIDDVISEFEASAKKKNIRLENQGRGSDAVAVADRSQIHQVLTNLVENALKYTPEGGQVRINILLKSSQLEVSVQDSGIGIPSQDLPRIFERFYRVDKARSREMGGTGLGLSIVKHIVEAHGGFVRVESHLGEGSIFTFCLPVTSPS